jgi:hypothetical protein
MEKDFTFNITARGKFPLFSEYLNQFKENWKIILAVHQGPIGC